jgi:glycosyltransferase involved in cell wall biosynthesis
MKKKLLLISLSDYTSLNRGIYKQILAKLSPKYRITVLCYGKKLRKLNKDVLFLQGNLFDWIRHIPKDVDKIFITDFFIGGLFGIILSKLRKIPVVLRCGSPWKYVIDSPIKLIRSFLVSITKPFVIKNCKIVIYNSKSIVQKQYKHNWCVVYNGVDIKLFKPMKVKKVSEKLNVLFVGRVCREKGLNYLFPAVEQITNKVHLGIIGDGPKLKHYKNNYTFAKFYGNIEHTKLPQIINQYDIVILPSLHNSSESFPNALLEAMACGKPVIGTNVWGIPEMIKHNYNGLIIPSKDISAIRKAIMKLNSKPLRTKFYKATQKFILERSGGDLNKYLS